MSILPKKQRENTTKARERSLNLFSEQKGKNVSIHVVVLKIFQTMKSKDSFSEEKLIL